MYYLLESLFVGLYSLVIYLILKLFVLSSSSLYFYFTIGFVKHLFGYFTGIHNYYYLYGDACQIDKNKECEKGNKYNNTLNLFQESVLEGVWFMICIMILRPYFPSIATIVFLVGVATHILAENVGIHREFCKKRCL
jgi:hypothetical protein